MSLDRPENRDLSPIKLLPENKNWTWVNQSGSYYLQSDLLSGNGFKHGFFTKRKDSLDPIHLSKGLAEDVKAYYLKQIHSNKIINASETNQETPFQADCLISDNKKQSLWVYSADCMPILLADNAQGKVASCHVGWRGLALGILPRLIRKMEEKGVNKNSLLIAIGPAICSNKYPVELGVVEEIIKNLKCDKTLYSNNSQKIVEELRELGAIIKTNDKKKIFLDIKLIAKYQLELAGLETCQVTLSNVCTASHPSLFNSWRRDKKKAIQWSGIISRP
ncbi:peptidoglycan editing factor PgeF [Prochlorococcus sp. MIT 1300]|uniref:peptidoglycan editing factor PgeF n=1 Tax=Prochlorococcus sp. MIT 1300 TaxID=3096218 RepID=UPI002A74D314|nr:peptidoglycan editing factor PgeF [Prochlorococcus sp. MIT 1300]